MTIRTTYKYACDLDKGTYEVNLRNALMQADSQADAFRVSVTRNGADVDVDGMNAYGYLYVASNQTTIALAGTVSGNTAEVVLTSDCYAVPGYASLVIQLHDGDVRHSVLKVNMHIERTGSNRVLTGGDVLPTLAELLNKISAMEQATEEARTAAAAADAAREGIQGDLAALTEEMSEIENDLDIYFVPGKNLINLDDAKNYAADAYVSDSANVNALASWSCIAVRIDAAKGKLSVNYPSAYLVFLAEYDDGLLSKIEIPSHIDGLISAVVGEGSIPEKVQNVEIPANATWVIVSGSTAFFPSLQLQYGAISTSYEPHKKTLNPTLLPYPSEVNVTDYTNLRECLENITPTKDRPVIVNIPDGVYDIKSMYTADEIADSAFRGLFVPDYCTLRGIGSREKTILTYSNDATEPAEKISTINIYNVAGLENITIEASNIRYCVHDDYATSYNGENVRNVKNCIFRKIENGLFACAYGAGHKGNAQWLFENCVFIGNGATFRGFSVHNNAPVTKDSNIILKNCRFRGEDVSSQMIRADSFNDGVTGFTYLILVGCGFNNASRIVLAESSAASYGAGNKTKVSGYANSFGNSDVTITVTDGVDYSSYVDLV